MSFTIPENQTVVYTDHFQVITWNEGATFNVYFQMEQDKYRCVDCFTVYDVDTIEKARGIATEHAEFNNEILV